MSNSHDSYTSASLAPTFNNSFPPKPDVEDDMTSTYNFHPAIAPSIVSTNTAIRVGQRHLGRGGFYTSQTLQSPGINDHGSREDYTQQTPRTVFSVDGATFGTFNSNLGLSDGTDCTLSDVSVSSTDPNLVLYQQNSESFSDLSESTVEYDGPVISPDDYTTTTRYQFGENPIPCVFEFLGCHGRYWGDQKDAWKECANFILKSKEPPTGLKCTHGGCNTEIEVWDRFLNHLFDLHCENTETAIGVFIPDLGLLDYCLNHELLDQDKYNDCLVRFKYVQPDEAEEY